MKRFAILCVCLVSLAALNGCCWSHGGPWGAGYGGGGACPPCGTGGYGPYGAGYGAGYPATVSTPGAYYNSAYTIANPIYAPTTALAPLNPIPVY